MSDHIVAIPEDCPACLKEELAELREELSAARALKLDTGHIPTLSDADLDHFERYLGFGGGETSRITLGLIREVRSSRAAITRVRKACEGAQLNCDNLPEFALKASGCFVSDALRNVLRALEGEQT
jgi:hypothetical protein